MAWLPVSAPSALTKSSLVQRAPQLLGAEARERMLDRARCRAGAPRPRRCSCGVMPAQRGLLAQSCWSLFGGRQRAHGVFLGNGVGVEADADGRTVRQSAFVGRQGQEVGESSAWRELVEQARWLRRCALPPGSRAVAAAAPAGRAARVRAARNRSACRRRRCRLSRGAATATAACARFRRWRRLPSASGSARSRCRRATRRGSARRLRRCLRSRRG